MEVEDELPRLLRALALSQRFHLYIAQCASPGAADRLIAAIERELPKLRGAPVWVSRLEPYAAQPTDAPLTHELIDNVLVPLLDPPEERRRHGTIHVVDASRASSSDDETWARLFASWNEKRNRLQRLQGEVVVVLPRALSLVFATEAPDVWSIRSGEYEIADAAERSVAGRSFEVPGDRVAKGGRGFMTRFEAVAAEIDDEAERSVAGRSFEVPGDSVAKGGRGFMTRFEAVAAEIDDDGRRGRPTWRLVPPLSLFSGDIVIADWLGDVLRINEVREISTPLDTPLDHSVGPVAERLVRTAEVAIGDRRFAEAEHLLTELVDDVDSSALEASDVTIQLRVQIALALSLAAQDLPVGAWRHAERALALAADLRGSTPGFARVSALGAAAYVAWCLGELAHAAHLEEEREAEAGKSTVEVLLLRTMERGHMREARKLAATLARPQLARRVEARRQDLRTLAHRMVAADFAFVAGDVAEARRDVEDAVARSTDPELIAGGALIARARPMAALLALAHSDIAGAERILHGRGASSARFESSMDVVHRSAAFEAYAAGVAASMRGDRRAASAHFEAARQAIARWAAAGFDRRSLARARVATLVAACAVDDDRARAATTAAEAVQRATALLGATGEDCIARVLAVEACWASARCEADPTAARALAREAIELAQPLRAAGVELWTALADRRVEDLDLATAD